jgi:hypothetical protein
MKYLLSQARSRQRQHQPVRARSLALGHMALLDEDHTKGTPPRRPRRNLSHAPPDLSRHQHRENLLREPYAPPGTAASRL